MFSTWFRNRETSLSSLKPTGVTRLDDLTLGFSPDVSSVDDACCCFLFSSLLWKQSFKLIAVERHCLNFFQSLHGKIIKLDYEYACRCRIFFFFFKAFTYEYSINPPTRPGNTHFFFNHNTLTEKDVDGLHVSPSRSSRQLSFIQHLLIIIDVDFVIFVCRLLPIFFVSDTCSSRKAMGYAVLFESLIGTLGLLVPTSNKFVG